VPNKKAWGLDWEGGFKTTKKTNLIAAFLNANRLSLLNVTPKREMKKNWLCKPRGGNAGREGGLTWIEEKNAHQNQPSIQRTTLTVCLERNQQPNNTSQRENNRSDFNTMVRGFKKNGRKSKNLLGSIPDSGPSPRSKKKKCATLKKGKNATQLLLWKPSTILAQAPKHREQLWGKGDPLAHRKRGVVGQRYLCFGLKLELRGHHRLKKTSRTNKISKANRLESGPSHEASV